MANLLRLQNNIGQVKEDFFRTNRISEDYRYDETFAAVQIQSWFRGCQLRDFLRHLHRNATIIQKIWRGYRARACFRQTLKTAYFMMKMNFFNEMAVRIQRRWRGFYVRKYVHNYHARRHYLEGLARKNEQVRRDLEEFGEIQRRVREHSEMERKERERCDLAQKMHHLLSTQQRPGVFNSPFRVRPHEMELRMRSVEPALIKAALQKRKSLQGLLGTNLDLHTTQPLPPIPSRKPQGPFCEAMEVQKQRHRPLEPSLRVATSITALAEAREDLRGQERAGRNSARPFQPFSNAHKSRKYEGMIHTCTLYDQVAYGSKHFREENLEKLQGKAVKTGAL
ncbi:hypothetical protein AAFF_G00396840 [Aldrovandia affinis]|uniref:Spermatogenesis associated 17 n=1 Tax=Aldrovandia affinis TaxID=143900 RepID=A0AAD7WKF3_9TELE|nr:hypothetical protein AAFF_G00396840 [Aldrovandia affinis]